jgi:hypothetical protein
MRYLRKPGHDVAQCRSARPTRFELVTSLPSGVQCPIELSTVVGGPESTMRARRGNVRTAGRVKPTSARGPKRRGGKIPPALRAEGQTRAKPSQSQNYARVMTATIENRREPGNARMQMGIV